MFNNPKQKAAVLFFAVICVIAFFERKPENVEPPRANAEVQPASIAEVKDLKSNDVGKKIDYQCTTSISGITFPEKEYVRGVYIPRKACLDGVDITRFISDGREITSSSYNKVIGAYYYTLYDESKGSSKIVATCVFR